MNKKVNAEKGKQGFQKTTSTPRVPTSSTRPLVRSNATVGPEQPQVDYRALAAAAQEQRVKRTRTEVLDRARTYLDDTVTLTPAVLTDDERQRLENACWDESLSEFGTPPTPPQDSTREALDLTQQHPYVGAVIRRCYFGEDGELRRDVIDANYTAEKVEMNVAFADEVAKSPHDRTLRTVASLVHASTEYANDRDSSEWPYTYPGDGVYPDLDQYVSEQTGLPLLRINNERLAAGLVRGHWGPNSG